MGQIQSTAVPPGIDVGVALRPAGGGEAVAKLPNEMLRAVSSTHTKEAALTAVVGVITKLARLEAILFYERASNNQLSDRPRFLGGDTPKFAVRSTAITAVCNRACALGAMQVEPLSSDFPFTVVAVPVVSSHQAPEAICAILTPDAEYSADHIGKMLQFAAAHMTLWYVMQTSLLAEQDAKNSAALLEILTKIESCESLDQACLTLVNELQPFLACERIAVGICVSQNGPCRLRAISGHAGFDKHAEFARSIEAALDETLLLDELVVWPPADKGDQRNLRTYQTVVSAMGGQSVISSPLYDEHGRAVGGWLFLNPRDEPGRPTTKNFVQAAQRQVGALLHLLSRSQPGPLIRTLRRFAGPSRRRRAVYAVAGTAALIVLLCLPIAHKIGCDLTIQPVVRRLVAAPFDGTLEKTLVEPGQLVSEGQVLALMEGREIRLELSGLNADYGRARKKWEASLAVEKIPEAQLANLEMKRLEAKIQLFTERQQNLQIRSPLNGIVISGDLEKSEGAPLSVGQGLFEIAPLDRMRVDVAIPEQDIAYVKPGMAVRIRLDAYPGELYLARIKSIVPRAELRENEAVFIARTELDNAAGRFRPGMNGGAIVVAPRRPLAWLLFHKPYESLLMMFGW